MFHFKYSAFQEHTERMRNQLAQQMKQKVDDEDERIAKALAEREAKREVRMNAFYRTSNEKEQQRREIVFVE